MGLSLCPLATTLSHLFPLMLLIPCTDFCSLLWMWTVKIKRIGLRWGHVRGKNNKIVATWRQWRWEWCSLRVRLGWQVSTSFCQQTFMKFISAILARDRDLYNTNGCPTWKLLVLVSFSKPESRIPGGVTEFTNQFRHSRDKHKHLQLLDNSRDGEACVKSEKLVLLKGFQIPFPCWLTQNKSTGF